MLLQLMVREGTEVAEVPHNEDMPAHPHLK